MHRIREVGFTVLDFQELRAPESARGQRYFVTADWARRWPAEQVWRLRKEGERGSASRHPRRA